MTLPDNPTRQDCTAYVVLRERPDIWREWVKYARAFPIAPASAIAIMVRVNGTPIDASLATSFQRIYYASEKAT